MIEQQKIKDTEAKKLREDARLLREEELRMKIAERQRIRHKPLRINANFIYKLYTVA